MMIRRIVAAIVHHQNYFIKIEHLQQAHFLLLIWLSTFTLLFWIISIPSVKCSMLNSGNVRQQPNIQPDFHSMTLLHYDDKVDDEQMDESYLSDAAFHHIDKNNIITTTYLCDKDGSIGIHALGMQSESIPDSSLSASSAFEMLHVGPQNARLNKDKSGGAWCPSKQLGPDTSGTEWIQVDLGSLHVVTGVATQGRFGKGLGQEFTEWYSLYYSRQTIPVKWIKWKSLDGRTNLEGNIDPNTVRKHYLSIPMVAVRHVRIVPVSNHTRTVCLRFELFGCSYQGPISYTLPAAHEALARRNLNQLLDLSYDGSMSSTGIWSGGLGQLTDGIKSLSAINSKQKIVQEQNWIWVGWPRIDDGSEASSVTMSFEFDQVYNFTSISLNCRQDFDKNIKAFASALLWFSLDYQRWSHSAISFEYQSNVDDNHGAIDQSSRDIVIPLQHRIGQFIRIELIYTGEWLQLSEISFDFNTLPSNLTFDQKNQLFEWTHSEAYAISAAAAAGISTSSGTRYNMMSGHDNVMLHNHSSNNIGKNKYPIGNDNQESQAIKYSLIIACLCTLGLVIISLLTSFIFKKLNLRKNNVFTEISDPSDMESENAAINMKNLPKESGGVCTSGNGSPLYCSPKEICSIQDEAEYAIPDVICPNNLSRTLALHSNNDNHNGHHIVTTANSIVCKTINPRFYASSDIIHAKQNIYGTRIQPPIRNILDASAYFRTIKNGSIQNVLHQRQLPLLDTFCNPNNQHGNIPMNCTPLRSQRFYSNDFINGTFGVRIYSESEIGVIQSLGKSKYGDILLCNIPVTTSTLATSTTVSAKTRLVIVRTVNDLVLKNEFIESMDYQRKISQQHIDTFARLLGIIETPTYFASIIEYGDCDLNYFLRKSTTDILSFDALLYIASQIANACVHLESIKQTHQDLATRNVIIYEKNLLIKITDGAVNMDKYKHDYYNGLPIRWMSPQSIVQQEFDSYSEVYSFGVCFWEILTMAKYRPFIDLTDEQFLAMVYAYINHGETMDHLPRPAQCQNKEIYQLLQECLDPDQNQRPTFKEISIFLQRKSLNFTTNHQLAQ
ncbi:discoidin domain-containing receptor 2-like [Dermatophagoides pteronyssinus]|uniref:discoidin domain-containing receptor 2-like n=1 Tax=Dermatophagoides pteronyssinus TaxID=6956 RepID=UPI003F66153B